MVANTDSRPARDFIDRDRKMNPTTMKLTKLTILAWTRAETTRSPVTYSTASTSAVITEIPTIQTIIIILSKNEDEEK